MTKRRPRSSSTRAATARRAEPASAPSINLTDDLIWHIDRYTIPAALGLLPGAMTSPEARAMLLATGLQESEFHARRQGGHGTTPGQGPARSFWQFERMGGVAEILTGPTTAPIIIPICRMFLYEPTPAVCHVAIENHDVLAACFARLLLYVDPRTMPSPIETDKGWSIYLKNWRPGAPRPADWPRNFARAWQIVKGT